MTHNRFSTPDQTGRAGKFWCNLCQEECNSDQMLRDHYRRCHPEVAAKIEAMAAHMAPGDTRAQPGTEDLGTAAASRSSPMNG